MTIYHNCKCGCIIERENMQLNSSSTPYPLLCPNHGDVTENRFIFCAQCGDKRVIKGNNNCNSFLCVPCQHNRNIENMRKHNKNRSQKGGRKKSIKNVGSSTRSKYDTKKDLERRSNCKYAMEVCFRKYDQYNNMPCRGCKQFEQQEFEIDCVTNRVEEVVFL